MSESHHRWLQNRIRQESTDSTNMVCSILDGAGLVGYFGKFTDSVIEDIRKRPEVKSVGPNQVVRIANQCRKGDVRTKKRFKRS